MRKVFYKDSFRVLIRLTDCAGHTVAPPSCDWSARIYTPGSTRFVSIGYSAGERRGWTPEGDAIAVAVDNHGLRPGPLLADFQFCLQSDAMPDGCQELQRSYDLELRLSERQECCMPSAAEATLLLPFIKGEKGDQGDQGDKGEQGEVSAAQLEEVHSELRREIVGLWDETAAIQTKLADLYSTECANLLRRLGYEQEDIDEFIWAVTHLNLPITMDVIRGSVYVWENKIEIDGRARVAPKWTQELEDSEWTPESLREKYFARAYYLPHLTTAKGFWGGNSTFSTIMYSGGIHATAETNVVVYMSRDSMYKYGLGSFTGKISKFSVLNGLFTAYFRCLKSDIPINLDSAFCHVKYVTDLSGVYLKNATNLRNFAAVENQYDIGQRTLILPDDFLPENKSVFLGHAFGGNEFTGETFDLRGRLGLAENIFMYTGSYMTSTHVSNACKFIDCDIHLDASDADESIATLGYMVVPEGAVSRLSVPGFARIDPTILVSYTRDRYDECGVWEVDCPDAEDIISSSRCGDRTSATFWNLGSSLKKDVYLKYMMRSYQQRCMFKGGMYNNPVLRESFRASLRTWKEPPFAAKIYLYSEQYQALTEEDVADITEKGYTLVVNDNVLSSGDYGMFGTN